MAAPHGWIQHVDNRIMPFSSNDIKVDVLNASFIQLHCDESQSQEFSDYFTFDLPEAKYMANFRRGGRSRGRWDGKIRLFDKRSSRLPLGLFSKFKFLCNERQYNTYITSSGRSSNLLQREWSELESANFVASLRPTGANGNSLVMREDQLNAVTKAIRNRRSLILSPTASGKSLISYVISMWHQSFNPRSKGLVIVPRIQLCHQLYKDWCDYSLANGYDAENKLHIIHAGKDKSAPNKSVYISTWQSLFELPPEYFLQFDYVIGDEAHEFKAKSLMYIMNCCVNAWDRVGLTGTLDGSKTNKMILEGLFGEVERVITTRELMDKGAIAKLNPIKVLCLKHPQDVCNIFKKTGASYEDEIQYLISSVSRNKFITNLALSLKGNTLILYQRVEDHGKILYDILKEKTKDNSRKVFFIHGGVDSQDREDARRIVENEENAIIVASFGTFSTGINIRNLHNVIFAAPTKSKIRSLQSIGRGLRIGDAKDNATLFDIADDFRVSEKSRPNFTYTHLEERLKIYISEKFSYKLYNIKLEEQERATLYGKE